MIKIFGLRILTKKDVDTTNENMDLLVSKINLLTDAHFKLADYVIAIDDIVDLLAEEKVFKKVSKPKPTKKTKK
ncbi:hypothetical protein [Methanoculleus sp.]|uniref:hypothetical protein n=1 Tax=Methanoculleus sp. TaxID=90427 RepID=UPI0025EB9EF9|nr:hypothetical protein [Methanoculleus sp.]MCK9319746.1 hypothetical protein [Methanoculleus sp.]